MDDFGPLLIILFIVIAVIAGIFGHLHQKRRRDELLDLALKLGFSFTPHKDRSHDTDCTHFAIFRRGDNRAAYNTLEGHLEIHGQQWPVKMGDFTYTTTSGSGKNRRKTTHRFSYLIIRMPFMGVPSLLIRPEGIFDKVSSFFGFADINFESAEFSRRFFVKCADRKFAYDVIHPRMMEFLLATRPPVIDIERGRCCISDGSRCWTAEQFLRNLEWVQEFFDHWPQHVTADLQQRLAVPPA
jgi:hypothetical protein